MLEAMRHALLEPLSEQAILTEDERWLVRRWAGGQSDRDLAKVMGIAPSNVNVRKQRVYAKLRTYLESLGLIDKPDAG
jgi:DNA-binding CsgD family transcriptional regulator